MEGDTLSLLEPRKLRNEVVLDWLEEREGLQKGGHRHSKRGRREKDRRQAMSVANAWIERRGLSLNPWGRTVKIICWDC